jgi:hypothetical protein
MIDRRPHHSSPGKRQDDSIVMLAGRGSMLSCDIHQFSLAANAIMERVRKGLNAAFHEQQRRGS